jgi:Holliday junction resolvase RusA-like endonuclease
VIIVDVFVPGAAKTKGSMVARPNGSMKESVIGSSQWRALMAQAVRDDIARRQPPVAELRSPWPGAVSVTVAAYLAPRPPREGVWLSWPIWERAGDLDKLVRNVLDALGSKSKNPKMNGGAIVDDNLVCKLIAEKHVAGDEPFQQQAGVRIVVETL